MQDKQAAGYFLEIVAVMAVLGALVAVAIPNVGNMVNKGKMSSQASELHIIQTAVTQMLYDSDTGALVAVGPTSNISNVRTSDVPPFVLKDYLMGMEGDILQLGCNYTFTSDGTVRQVIY